MTQRGFTLLEVLIAVALFSLLGLACYRLLERVMHSDQRIAAHEVQLRQLQRALGLFERDLTQAIASPLGDDPSRRQALIGQPDNLRLVRGGWSNPLHQPRSEVLEVGHTWRDGQWRRQYRSPPRRELETPPQHSQRLLDGINGVRLRYIDSQGEGHDSWPVASAPLSLPRALELELDAPGYPGVRRVILLPGFEGDGDA
ncbi:type II secretion system minor pseudopilin GspJ [Pseudomonas sp. D(2018)]|uniref:type II secretion system minor pseudopilin GspJ n=1 Tax=Pseudomonadaceae TaxID=135621 RepID=UPI0010F44EB5|nr:type II secretion system minor pseudopilin GspJ [Pseudomonas sp. D(2018)]